MAAAAPSEGFRGTQGCSQVTPSTVMRQPASTYRPRLSGMPCSRTRVGAVAGFTHSATGLGFHVGPPALLCGSAGSPTCCASSVSRSTWPRQSSNGLTMLRDAVLQQRRC